MTRASHHRRFRLSMAAMSIHDFFRDADVDVAGLASYLDGLAGGRRVAEARDLDAAEQARLFDAAAGHRRITLDDFVPRGSAPLPPVIHFGRNSLPMFKI